MAQGLSWAGGGWRRYERTDLHGGPRAGESQAGGDDGAGRGPEAGRVVIDAVTSSGRPATVELTIRRDTVEVWSAERCRAVLDRDAFRVWLAHPVRALIADDVLWAPADGSSVALVVGGAGETVGPWTLAAHVFEDLRWRV